MAGYIGDNEIWNTLLQFLSAGAFCSVNSFYFNVDSKLFHGNAWCSSSDVIKWSLWRQPTVDSIHVGAMCLDGQLVKSALGLAIYVSKAH
jgi:hypothetical protein